MVLFALITKRDVIANNLTHVKVPREPVGNDDALYYDVTVRLEIQPTDSYNVVRIIAPCFFQGSGVGAHPWPSVWVVSWPTQTFCYKIDSSV